MVFLRYEEKGGGLRGKSRSRNRNRDRRIPRTTANRDRKLELILEKCCNRAFLFDQVSLTSPATNTYRDQYSLRRANTRFRSRRPACRCRLEPSASVESDLQSGALARSARIRCCCTATSFHDRGNPQIYRRSRPLLDCAIRRWTRERLAAPTVSTEVAKTTLGTLSLTHMSVAPRLCVVVVGGGGGGVVVVGGVVGGVPLVNWG